MVEDVVPVPEDALLVPEDAPRSDVAVPEDAPRSDVAVPEDAPMSEDAPGSDVELASALEEPPTAEDALPEAPEVSVELACVPLEAAVPDESMDMLPELSGLPEDTTGPLEPGAEEPPEVRLLLTRVPDEPTAEEPVDAPITDEDSVPAVPLDEVPPPLGSPDVVQAPVVKAASAESSSHCVRSCWVMPGPLA